MSKPFCKHCGLNELDFWAVMTGYLVWGLAVLAALGFGIKAIADRISISISFV